MVRSFNSEVKILYMHQTGDRMGVKADTEKNPKSEFFFTAKGTQTIISIIDTNECLDLLQENKNFPKKHKLTFNCRNILLDNVNFYMSHVQAYSESSENKHSPQRPKFAKVMLNVRTRPNGTPGNPF
jgi:hypothetical protein